MQLGEWTARPSPCADLLRSRARYPTIHRLALSVLPTWVSATTYHVGQHQGRATRGRLIRRSSRHHRGWERATAGARVRFDNQRNQLMQRAGEIGLAEPVAMLVATAYEPRIDGEELPEQFEQLVHEQQLRIRDTLAELTPDQGGKVESAALSAARELHQAADQFEVSGARRVLQAALDRCSGAPPGARLRVEYEFNEPRRVTGPTGRPIGLWR